MAKKKKFSLTITSDSEDVLKQFHSFMVNHAEQHCLIFEETGEKAFYPEIEWNEKDRKDLDLKINCDFTMPYEFYET